MNRRAVVFLLPNVFDAHAFSLQQANPLLRFADRLSHGRNAGHPMMAALLTHDTDIHNIRRLLPNVHLRLGMLHGIAVEERWNISVGSLVAAWAHLLADVEPLCTVLPHTIDGVQLAAALSVRLKAACISGVIDVDVPESSEPMFHRYVDNGHRVARITSDTQNVVVTVDSSRFAMEQETPFPRDRTIEVRRIDAAIDRRCRVVDRHRPSSDTRDLDRAGVIVSVGRGLGKAENLPAVEAFAATFPASSIAGSRGACDAGWIPAERQIGVTGKTVSPEIYFALGISGASQHIAGMQSSKTVVSINTDPHAPIFRHSDVGIVADMFAFIAAWIDRVSSLQKGKLPCP